MPLFGEPQIGYSPAEGYRLPPVMFTREEAAALLAAEKLATQQVMHLDYQAMPNEPATPRDIEPIGLYLTQHWHVVAYCRLRQAFRTFRLDRIQQLTLRPEFVPACRIFLY